MTEEEWLECIEPLRLVQSDGKQFDGQRFKYLAANWGTRLRDTPYLEDRFWLDGFTAWVEGKGNHPTQANDLGFDYMPRLLQPPPQWRRYLDQFLECLKAGKLIEASAYAAESIAQNIPDFVAPVNFDKEHRGRSSKKRQAEKLALEARRKAWQAECVARSERVRREFCNQCRDIFGNPFRPVSINPSWLTSTVVALASGIYSEKAFDRMPILADALQDAGCDNAEVLNHCRQPGEHVRGCWVIDLLLSKE